MTENNESSHQSTDTAPRSIGVAWMEEDGTISLQLRAEGPGKVVGDALLTYPKTHPKYEDILKHLGGLKPGEYKPVSPWNN
ncbi:MAG: hypothetical protein HY711_00855 [Candidatus Melainabacteria bacterium]|nr:hypothetical protein [Candidatus Melainabacteria bacterium]